MEILIFIVKQQVNSPDGGRCLRRPESLLNLKCVTVTSVFILRDLMQMSRLLLVERGGVRGELANKRHGPHTGLKPYTVALFH